MKAGIDWTYGPVVDAIPNLRPHPGLANANPSAAVTASRPAKMNTKLSPSSSSSDKVPSSLSRMSSLSRSVPRLARRSAMAWADRCTPP